MDNLIEEFVKGKKFVLAGASKNKEKYGNIILHKMIGHKFEVIPVNPKENEIDGIKTYNSILDIKEDTPYVNFVLPAKIGLKMVNSLVEKGCQIAWLQPGASSDELVSSLVEKGIKVIHGGPCIMVAGITHS